MIFHKDAHGFPNYFNRPVGVWGLDPTHHAIARAAEKGFDIPEKIAMRDFTVIELEVKNMNIVKMVIRGEFDDRDDICMAVIPRRGRFTVKTAWLNAWDDKHDSLNVEMYAKP